MLTETSDAILQQLAAIEGIKTVEEWAGEVEELLKAPHKLPGLFLVYGGGEYGDGPAAIGTAIAPTAQAWSVILIAKNLRSRGDGALECYAFVEAVRARLTRFQPAAAGGWLWPVREELIFAKGGILAYGIDFTLETEV